MIMTLILTFTFRENLQEVREWKIFVHHFVNIMWITLRKSHLRKSYLVGLSEVGLPESISHQKVPPQLLCIICTVFALQASFEPARYSK